MRRDEIVSVIRKTGMVAVVRADTPERAVRVADACAQAGIVAIEIAFTVSGAHRIIETLAGEFAEKDLILGAGTVLDPETARIAILSGARYIVSPCLNREVITLCNRYQVPSMPGAMTILETVACMEAGADMVKIFPGELFGPAIIKAIRGPLPQAPLMPTGGVTLENAADWIRAGADALGVGGSLTAAAAKDDFQQITEIGRRFLGIIRDAKGGLFHG
jgi:2-dehydro-3-deoxyphosphogluconate aldolase/(4S)-4-hydroxy-2-oxoglutarate aldolase